jgi:cytochrome c oxidase subunit 2
MTGMRPWRFAPAAASVLLGGCSDNQSVLNPQGPEALQLAHLSWLLFALGTIVFLLVVVATAAAIRGPQPLRAVLASAHTVVWAGIIFPVITLTALLGYGVWLTRASMAVPGENDVLRIEVVGEQWWWRVTYPEAGGPSVATANEIRIPVGRPILFTLQSADVIHSFWVPNLGGKMDMIPGRTTHLRLRADHAGVFRGQCAEYCGGPHALMALEVVAMPPAEFEAWMQGQARPAAEPSSEVTRRGQELFLAAGCGACHAVGGTPATGTVGPDLTHLGSRRSIGVDTVAMTQDNIARFIRDGQHIKPGNLMPPFRIFTPADLDAVAAYLAGLR